MAMKTNKDHKTIHEDFPLEIWEEINEVKGKMTWYEFLPYAAKCAKRLQSVETTEMEEAVKEKRM